MPLSNWQIILVALLVVGGRLVLDFSQRIIEGQQKVSEQRQLEAELDALLQEHDDLEAAKLYYNSPAFIEAWAHNEGKMVRDGETLVVPLYAQTPRPPVTSAVEQQPEAHIPTWHVWWTLFFDSPPPFGQASQP
jgi:cell division protein FtsB